MAKEYLGGHSTPAASAIKSPSTSRGAGKSPLEAGMKQSAGGGGLKMFPSHGNSHTASQGHKPGRGGPNPVSPRRQDGPMSKAGGKAPKYSQHVNNLIDKGGKG